MIHTTLAFIATISLIVFIHELGHYVVAKWAGVHVESFSIGFGPEIIGFNDRSGTRWKISVLPLGGYVKMYGDKNPASVPQSITALSKLSLSDYHRTFHAQPLATKARIVLAGPLANFLLAIAILTTLFMLIGRAETSNVIDQVQPDSPAAMAGVRSGDKVLAIDDAKVKNFLDIQRILSLNTGTPITLTLEREGEKLSVTLMPLLHETDDGMGNTIKKARIGIKSLSTQAKQDNLISAFLAATEETYHLTMQMCQGIYQMVVGKRSTDELGGVIRMAKYSGQSAERGWVAWWWLTAVLSINLGLVNLFPIPMLDGGHLLFYAIEAIRGKPLEERLQSFGFKIGLAFLIAITFLATCNDIRALH